MIIGGGRVLATKVGGDRGGACHQGGVGPGAHVFFGEAGFRVVGLVARPTYYKIG